MATKTKIIDGITIVTNKEEKISYGFKRMGKNTVAVTSAICVAEDKFKHAAGRGLILNRFDTGSVMNLRLPADRYGSASIAAIVNEIIEAGNDGNY